MVRKWFQEKADDEKNLSVVISSEQRQTPNTAIVRKMPKSKKNQSSVASASAPYDITEETSQSPIFSPIRSLSKTLFSKKSTGSPSQLRKGTPVTEKGADENVVRTRILEIEDVQPNWEGGIGTL